MNNNLNPKKCKATIFTGWTRHQCRFKAKHDGFCGKHHPENIKKVEAAIDKAYKIRLKKLKQRIVLNGLENATIKQLKNELDRRGIYV